MDWSFRYEGAVDGLEAALEKHRQGAKLMPDDRAQFELVAKMLIDEAAKAPARTERVVVSVSGAGELVPESKEGPKPTLRSLSIRVTMR